MSKPDHTNKNQLERMYHEEGLTTREIADVCGVTNGTVSYWLNKHGVDTRDNWKEGVKAAKKANRVERAIFNTLPTGYEYWQQKESPDKDGHRKNRMVYVHRLLAVSEHGFDSLRGKQVHHKNNVPWDNRPDNIEILDPSEHGRKHTNERWGNSKPEWAE